MASYAHTALDEAGQKVNFEIEQAERSQAMLAQQTENNEATLEQLKQRKADLEDAQKVLSETDA